VDSLTLASPRAVRIVVSTATARIARIILVSTVLSFLTFSATVSWLA
jgi:ABC-type dipeptide/oligopeptide/nickel transport system permease subunit